MKLFLRLVALLAVIGSEISLCAQVMMPMELPDPKAQHLQQKHLKTLMAIGTEIGQHKFPYPFYFSRVLDVDLARMQAADQRSIRFDIYKNQTVLEITGNYYAAYAADRMDSYARLKETFEKVITPILQAGVAHFPDDSEFSAFAVEVSHHVRQKVMGISSEEPENVTLVIPVAVAQKFVDAKTDDQRQAAILQAKIFLNGQPDSLWLQEGAPPADWKEKSATQTVAQPAVVPVSATTSAGESASPTVSSHLLKTSPGPMPIVTPETLTGLQRQNQDAIDRMVKALEPEVHFLPYASPTFIGFRQGAYLQLSFRTSLAAPDTSSRYKLAALAFDEHVSHLIRPTLDYFPADAGFEGLDFSSTIHFAGESKVEAVEFFFPLRMMRCFASYDCTGQQLLDSGTVVINGERSALDLQVAEGKN